MSRYTRKEWEEGSFTWVLLFTYAGVEYLFTSLPLTPPAGRAWRGVLPDNFSYTQEAKWDGLGGEVLSTSYEGLLPEVDIAALIERGYPLTSATGELSIYKEGDPWEDRERVYTGEIIGPLYGAKGEGISFSLEFNPYLDTATLPRKAITQAAVGDPVGSAILELLESPLSTMGSAVPVVFGNPGVYVTAEGLTANMPGSIGYGIWPYDYPGWLADPAGSAIWIAGASLPADWTTSTVVAYDGSGNYDTIEIAPGTDAEGDIVTVAAFISGASPLLDLKSGEYGIAWIDKGGIDGRAGELLEWFLRTSSLEVDLPRVNASKKELNNYLLGGYINELGTTPVEWLTDNYLPILPVAIVTGGDGVYPVLLDYKATTDSAVATVSPALGSTRVGAVTYIRSASLVENKITLRYCLDALDGDYRREVIHDTPDSLKSRATYGERAGEESTAVVWDNGTATLVLEWLNLWRGYTHREIVYEVPRSMSYLKLGDVVHLKDAELSLDRVAVISKVERDADLYPELTLLLLGGV